MRDELCILFYVGSLKQGLKLGLWLLYFDQVSLTIIQITNLISMFEIEFDKKEIEEALPHYKFIKSLGFGAFAKVYLVQHRQTRQQFALKKVSFFGMGEYEKAGAANEVRILSSLSHKNIIKVFECLFDSSEDILYIFMEYADYGDLNTLIEQARDRKKRIPESTVWKVINDVSQGLSYLHQNQIIHRDLKPANIFRMNRSFKIGDMNVSKVLKSGEVASTKTGSPFYTAPEVWKQNQGYDSKCDIWSLGILVFEICSLQVPYEADSIFELINKIQNQKGLKNLPTFYSANLNDLFRKMIEFDPRKRVSAEEILKISGEKLRIESEGLDEKAVDTLLKTIVFPEANQRWVNLIPSLPPKTSRNGQERTARSKSKNENKQPLQNNSGIFRSTERKPIQLMKSKSRSKLESSTKFVENNSEVKNPSLPPLCKISPKLPRKESMREDRRPDIRESQGKERKLSSSEKRDQVREKSRERSKQGSKQKRQSSSGSRTNRKSIIQAISEIKSQIVNQ